MSRGVFASGGSFEAKPRIMGISAAVETIPFFAAFLYGVAVSKASETMSGTPNGRHSLLFGHAAELIAIPREVILLGTDSAAYALGSDCRFRFGGI